MNDWFWAWAGARSGNSESANDAGAQDGGEEGGDGVDDSVDDGLDVRCIGCLAVHLCVERDNVKKLMKKRQVRRTLPMIHSLVLHQSKACQLRVFCKTTKLQMAV